MNFRRPGGQPYRPSAGPPSNNNSSSSSNSSATSATSGSKRSNPTATLSAAAAAARQRQQEAIFFAKARAKSAGMKSYFDDDDEEDSKKPARMPPSLNEEEGQDPLDAFMRANPLNKGDDDEGFVGRVVKRPRTAGERGDAGKEGGKGQGRGEQEEVDPLDAFMAGVQDKVKEESQTLGAKAPADKPMFLDAASDDEEDEGGYLGADRRGGALAAGGVGEGEEFDSDEEVYAAGAEAAEKARLAALAEGEIGAGGKYSRTGPEGKKAMEVLPPLDHAAISYAPFRKSFYQEAPAVAGMSWSEVQAYRDELAVQATGRAVPRPIRSFTEAGFGDTLLKEIVKRGFEAPTAIQAQALPAVLSGRDVIGIAKTGSGKTLAFAWPAVVHLMDQRELEPGDGPIALILAPTRELASQIYVEASKFAKPHGAKVAAVFGGAGKWEQTKLLKEGCEILVATPGRLIEMIKTKATNMRRCTLLVLDEADRMFDMGFEAQIRSVIGQIRPDRQTLLFSATFKKRVERLAQEALTDPVRIVVGTVGQANEDIRQEVVVLKDNLEKWGWLSQRLAQMVQAGKVLIFVSSKQGCDELAANLSQQKVGGTRIEAIHGDRDQHERSLIMRRFKQGETLILVATDVASRGLDVKNVNTVVNFDVAKSIEIHIHRIGRTGRMGVDGVHPGTAFTLVTNKDANFSHDLVRNLEMSKQPVPPTLRALAARAPRGGGGGNGFSRAGVGTAARGGGNGGGFGPSSHHQPGHHHPLKPMIGAVGGGGGYGAVPPPASGGIAFVRPTDAAQREHRTVGTVGGGGAVSAKPSEGGGAGAGAEGKRKSRWG